MDENIKYLGLTTPQYAVLSQLELESGISNAELARRSFITAQTMHGIVSNLEKRELIKRKKRSNHGIILCAELTNLGLKIVQKAHTSIRKVEDVMTSTMSEDKIALLENLLFECFNNLNSLKN